jgi:hypothetical protein
MSSIASLMPYTIEAIHAANIFWHNVDILKGVHEVDDHELQVLECHARLQAGAIVSSIA